MAVWALWPMDGAWLCCHLWEHYTYTLDKSQRTVTAERERVIYYFEVIIKSYSLMILDLDAIATFAIILVLLDKALSLWDVESHIMLS
ncbi:alpha-L-fucosidase [Trifolium repens]|nr:alpha-L-fucosidase [Trifolium repens]